MTSFFPLYENEYNFKFQFIPQLLLKYLIVWDYEKVSQCIFRIIFEAIYIYKYIFMYIYTYFKVFKVLFKHIKVCWM